MMAEPKMLAQLNQLATEIGALHSKIILLVGGQHAGKIALLAAFAGRTDAKILCVGSELGVGWLRFRRSRAIRSRQSPMVRPSFRKYCPHFIPISLCR